MITTITIVDETTTIEFTTSVETIINVGLSSGDSGSAVPSNLSAGTRTATAFPIDNDNGDGVTIPEATTSYAGLLNASDKALLGTLPASIAAKEPAITGTGDAGQYWGGDKAFYALNKSAVGLSNVDNTADSAKPVSTPQQTALNLKANVNSPTFTGTVGGISKSMVGLGNADNTSDTDKPVSTATQTALDLKVNSSLIGAASGIVPLNSSSLIPSVYLPSFVDDILEFANWISFPGTGETGKMYVALDTNKVYRWGGSAYIEISGSPGSTDAVPEGSANLYFTTARARAAISATGSLNYNSATGVMSYTAPTVVSAFTNDAGYLASSGSYANPSWITSLDWSKISSKPTTDGITEGSTNLFFTAALAIGSAITGFVSGAGVVAATDTILQAIQKLAGNISGKQDALSGTGFVKASGSSITYDNATYLTSSDLPANVAAPSIAKRLTKVAWWCDLPESSTTTLGEQWTPLSNGGSGDTSPASGQNSGVIGNRFGVNTLTSSSTAGTGTSWSPSPTTGQSVSPQLGFYGEAGFYPRSAAAASSKLRFGTGIAYNNSNGTDEIYLECDALVVTGKCRASSSLSTTGTSTTLTANTWYKWTVSAPVGAAAITFAVYNGTTGALIWTDTLSTNIPTAKLAPRWSGFNTAAAAQAYLTLDYLYWEFYPSGR